MLPWVSAAMGENGSQRSSWFVPSSIHPMFLSQLSPSVDLAVAVFLILTGVISVLGNGLVLFVHCRKRKKLRLQELMTVNLALCDFGSSLLGVPFFITSSLCHAWVFGETGCLWYGIQGFVFGIGSLLTTCLISLDRCLKICCLRYGQWIERHHVSLSIALMWVYTFFWAFLPAFGFGSYGPEPYGTSCTINWWAMRSSLIDRIYIFLILTLCFGLPTLAIITSYLAILLTVYRSNQTLASMTSSFVSHTSKDLKLAKMAAVVCGTFLLAWLPYATVSLISALIPSNEQEAEGTLQTVVEFSGTASTQILDFPSLVNWTTAAYYRQIYSNPGEKGSGVSNMSEEANPIPRSRQLFSCLPPEVTLIPAMFAKSHCMINPLIYQIMNLEFRSDVYAMLFGREKAERRRLQGRHGSSGERSISLSYCQSWRRKKSSPTSLPVDKRNLQEEKNQERSSGGRIGCWADNISVGSDALDITSLDTQRNMERHCSTGVQEETSEGPALSLSDR